MKKYSISLSDDIISQGLEAVLKAISEDLGSRWQNEFECVGFYPFAETEIQSVKKLLQALVAPESEYMSAAKLAMSIVKSIDGDKDIDLAERVSVVEGWIRKNSGKNEDSIFVSQLSRFGGVKLRKDFDLSTTVEKGVLSKALPEVASEDTQVAVSKKKKKVKKDHNAVV